MLTLDDVLAARERIRGGIYESPCVESIPLSQLTGARVWCKLDYLQRTGSFKERGARNALLRLPESQRSRGVVAASAGNHALGVAYHGSLLGVPVTVVMPRFAPLIKVTNCRALGATVILHGENVSEAREKVQRPDAPYLGYDPTRTSLTGVIAEIRGSKNAGNWLWSAEVNTQSPGFETNS